MMIILLAHSVVRTVKNPDGLDYPRWEPSLTKEVEEHLSRWTDAILFGRLDVKAREERKGRAKGGAWTSPCTRGQAVRRRA